MIAPSPFQVLEPPQLILWPQTDQSHRWQDQDVAFIHLSQNMPEESVLCNTLAVQSLRAAQLRHSRHNSSQTSKLCEVISAEVQGQLQIVFILKPCTSETFHFNPISKALAQILKRLKSFSPTVVYVNTTDSTTDQSHEQKTWINTVVQKLIHSYHLASYPLPQYQSKDSPAALCAALHIISHTEGISTDHIHEATCIAKASNEIRHLMMEPGNILHPRSFVNFIKKDHKNTKDIRFQFYSHGRLKRMGAGAFCAVSSAHPHSGAGIVKISTHLKNPQASIALVGKGVTYDVGGVNVKPPRYMKGMHHDMTGAAMAYACVKLAALLDCPYEVKAYLAISDNLISHLAYKPDDVVTSLSGQTIEVVHTDAEGRMMLADTLTLACHDHPDLIIDFATLTGASTAAISDRYHSIYTNRPQWHDIFLEASRLSGERVWPFPLDEEFAECLESKVADTKQCRLSGGVDHIEAALFLQKFLTKDIPWIHMDLSNATTEQAMGYHLSEETGSGPAFIWQLLKQLPQHL